MADGRSLVAALSLGADGMNMGTRFMATKEAPVHENVKQAMVEASERQTELIFRTLRNTARVFKNGIATQVVGLERRPEGAKIEDLAPLVSGQKGKVVLEKGDMEHGIWSAGQVVGLIKDIPTCKELIDRIVEQATEIIQSRLAGVVAEPAEA